jgi:hypothetical protein
VVDQKLADAVPTVTENYINFLRDTHADHETDPKLFAARHSAAKTALSHIEQLMKLAGTSEEEAERLLGSSASELDIARQEIEQETPEDDAGEPG